MIEHSSSADYIRESLLIVQSVTLVFAIRVRDSQLHLAIDADSHEVVSALITAKQVVDPRILPRLLEAVEALTLTYPGIGGHSILKSGSLWMNVICNVPTTSITLGSLPGLSNCLQQSARSS